MPRAHPGPGRSPCLRFGTCGACPFHIHDTARHILHFLVAKSGCSEAKFAVRTEMDELKYVVVRQSLDLWAVGRQSLAQGPREARILRLRLAYAGAKLPRLISRSGASPDRVKLKPAQRGSGSEARRGRLRKQKRSYATR